MPTKDERKAQAEKHSALMKGAFAAETAATVAAAVIYEDGEGRELELPEPAQQSTSTKVTTQYPAHALYDAKGKVAIVDPVSFTKPGGNYEEGSFGPEQALCSESNLYQVLQGMKRTYHDANRGFARGQLFTDRAMLLPDVVFSAHGEIRKAGIIAIPEPNRTRAREHHRSERECDSCLAQRIESILRIAAANGYEMLIMGAFACGRENYDQQQVVDVIQAWISAHPGALATIVFAVPHTSFDAFDAAFGQPAEEAPQVETATDKSDSEDEFDLDDVELPEGVTLRR